ncbi:unnamed protein product [Cylindrotheca closterium]|uniref:Uncharacterized protein n=1 Tax=Cylindrotheca closterium TaxID=2856 RepID=A0AAD2CYC1_9STRA|nr:unnamed protein product [Cylindrotheca closterium]
MMFPQAQSHGNVLTFTPPGFKQSLNVKFPDSRLPVCEKCKKNFKTRDMCRVRNGHTAAPWTTAFICMTLDDSCTDAHGKYVDKPFTVRMVPWQPYCVKEPFDPKTPVCAGCKRTNRTRSFCRERHRHRQLPWCTVYCVLSAVDTVDANTIVAAPSRPVEESSKSENDKDSPVKEDESKEASSPANGETESKSDSTKEGDENTKPAEKGSSGEGDDIHQIPDSRTFLAKVSCKSISIHWLELAESDGTDVGVIPNMHQHVDPNAYAMGPGGPGMPMPPDPNHPPYYHHPNMYAQQHPHSLKNQQQYFFPMQRHPSPYATSWPPHHYQQHPHILHGQQLASPPGAPPPPPPPQGEGSSPPLVTAGEAAAQQLKRNREDDRGQSPMHHPPPGHPHGPPPGPHGQQQQWMLYQQMYQSALPPMSHASAYPPQIGRHMPPPEGGPPMMHPPDNPYNRPQSPPNGKEHEADPKRQRLG